jgi:hypothetical protein
VTIPRLTTLGGLAVIALAKALELAIVAIAGGYPL